MNNAEIRQLRGQLILVGGLFLICTIAATIVATQRPFAESFLVEKYSEPSDQTMLAIEQAVNRNDFETMIESSSLEQRIELYQYWMKDSTADAAIPTLLIRKDFESLSDRIERTIVCGSDAQRNRAIQFCVLADDERLVPQLEHARRWARRRKMLEFASSIDSAIESIRSR